jgi:hypothetical protein
MSGVFESSQFDLVGEELVVQVSNDAQRLSVLEMIRGTCLSTLSEPLSVPKTHPKEWARSTWY